MTPHKKAIVIIPTYNERDNIGKVIPLLLEERENVRASWDLQVLVVDDMSPDKTYEVVEELTKIYKGVVHLLVNPKKSGLGGAYLKGMARAFDELGADAVFEFDADLSHDSTKIPAFLKALDSGADMVLGSRYIKGGSIPQDWGLHRKFLSIIGNIVIATVFTNFSVRDWTSGYRAITKSVYEAVHPELHSERFSGYTFQIGFLHTAIRKGFTVVEVPFHFIDRTIGDSKIGPEYIKNNLLYIFRVRAKEIYQHRVFRFAFVGGLGAMVQLLSLTVFRALLPEFSISLLTSFMVATFLSIETAIVSNFIINNSWTFSDKKLSGGALPYKFLQFNLASFGSIVIQLVIAGLGEWLIGIKPLFIIDTGVIFAVAGILIGMFWNFFAYTRLIWKTN